MMLSKEYTAIIPPLRVIILTFIYLFIIYFTSHMNISNKKHTLMIYANSREVNKRKEKHIESNG